MLAAKEDAQPSPHLPNELGELDTILQDKSIAILTPNKVNTGNLS